MFNTTDVPKSSRIPKLVEALYANMPVIESARAKLLTESYKATEGEPMVTRRAEAFAHILRNIPIIIRDNELIVGSSTIAPRGCQTFPEFSFQWLEDELDTVETRSADPFYIAEETKQELREVHKYWKGKTSSELATSYMDPEAIKAIEVGIDTVAELKEKGYNVFATGEMGIGNTTTSSAVCSVLLDQSVEKVTGKGAGLTNKDLEHKIEVIKQSIALNQVDANDPIDVLSKVGGLDIAGMVGCYIGGAALQVPVFIDGFISSVAALIAIRLIPECAPYLFPSHCSNEPAGRMILDAIGKQPYILANMCLGEGTGAVMGFTIADYAFKAYWELPSFEQTNFGTYEELN